MYGGYGINLFEGGPLSVFYDCIDTLVNKKVYKEYQIVLFVHKTDLFKEYEAYFEIIELPKSRKSYIYRLYYEYSFFYKYSCKHSPAVWLSLHDIPTHVRTK